MKERKTKKLNTKLLKAYEFPEVKNAMEVYVENLENDNEDSLGGTEDSYANEMFSQHLYDALFDKGYSEEEISEIENDFKEEFNSFDEE